jgi:hypothetical protein
MHEELIDSMSLCVLMLGYTEVLGACNYLAVL